ncbi:MAG: gliding motility protein GldM [Bacteroidota bacterium]
MSLPKEPRQKMINLMYLVLTALLALNVSAEILNAFKTVERSLTSTNNTINSSTNTLIASFKDKLIEPETAEKAKIWYPKAERAVALTKEMNTYIDSLKAQIMRAADFDPARKGDSTFKEENQDIATRLMIEEKRGTELRAKLDKYKKDMIALDPSLGKEIEIYLKQINLEVPATKSNVKSWENAYFYMVPTVAATTILTKFQNDVKTSENRTVALFHEQVGKVIVRYDAFAAIVGQSSNYIMPGQDIEITAGVGAFSKAAQPQITINGQSAPLGAEGQAAMKVSGGGLGKHSVPIVIRFMDQDGKLQTVNKAIEYTVGQANASIALDKMNVLYVGIANPITVAASGGGDDKVGVSISGGRLQKTAPGKYNAFVDGGDKVTVTVSVDGKVAGASEFRVRRIPTPTGTVGGYASGDNVNAGAFKSQAGVGAYIKDFPFDLKYTTTGFTISTDSDDGDIVEANVTGNAWGGNAAAQNVLRQVRAGKTVYIDGLRALGEDGRNYKLPSLVYYIK